MTERTPRDAALSFATHLADRAYEAAYALTALDYRQAVSLETLRAEFEEMIPDDWGEVGPVAVEHTMTDWPDKQDADLLWVYVSIGGDVYSEAVTLVVTSEGGEPRIRQVELGRP
jgi:hypothetical protein